MKIRRIDFTNALKKLQTVLQENKIRPIISNIKIENLENVAKLTATNLEQTMIIFLKTEDVEKEAFILPSDSISFINTLEDEFINISTDDYKVIIENAEFESYDIDNFPILDENVKGETNRTKELIKKLNKVDKFAGKDKNNLAINVVRIENNKIIGTDSFSMSIDDIDVSGEVSIPLTTVDIIKKSFNTNDEIEIVTDGNQIVFSNKEIMIRSRTVSLNFPKIESILSGITTNKKATFQTIEFEKACKKLSVFDKKMIIDFSKKTLNAKGDTKKIKEKININTDSQDRICLDIQKIMNCLSNVNEGDVNVDFTDKKSPCIIKSGSNTMLIMPIAYTEE